MTSQVTPPAKPSHWLRNASIGVVVVMVLLAALGSAARPPSSTAPETPAGPAASDAGSSAEGGSPAPVGTSPLLSIKGTGAKTSEDFRASGDGVDVTYDYTCKTGGSFTINFFGANESPLLPDILVSEFGTNGSATTTEDLNGAAGPFHIEVDSACDWSVKVLGTP